jgi:Peptidase A4 family
MRMVRRLIVSVAGLALVAGSLALGGPAMASQGHHAATRAPAAHVDNPGGLFRQTPGTHPAKVGGKTISYSTNWSGYAVTGSTFSSVSGSWTQPAVTCTSNSNYTDMSPWVGLDGYSSDTVEQTGTSGDCNGKTPDYYAWYEMYPANYVTIPDTVEPGDQFTGSVTHTSGTKYELVLTDVTRDWTYSVSKSLSADDNSAEAVLEMAANYLSKFSTDPFSSVDVDGKAIGSYTGSPYTIEQMEIKVGSTLCDSTSPLTNETNFTVTWLNAC